MDYCQLEKEYKWLEAAKSYEKTLQSESLPAAVVAEFWQRIGFCYNLASRQVGHVEEFKKLEQLAVEAYEKAADLFYKQKSLDNSGRSRECFAEAEYIRSWTVSNSSEKDIIFSKCRELCNEALIAYKEIGNELRYGNTCNLLSLCLFDHLRIISVGAEKRKIAVEGMEYAHNAISFLSKTEDKSELVFALSLASLQSWYLANISDREEDRCEFGARSLNYAKEAMSISKEVNNAYPKAIANWAGALATLFFAEEVAASLAYGKEMLKQASIVEDNFLRGTAYYVLAFATDWMVSVETDPRRVKEKLEEIVRFSEKAEHSFQLVCRDSDTAEAFLFYTESYSSLARDFAVTPMEKLALIKKALEVGEKGLNYAIRSGSPDANGSTLHALSKAYHYFSNLESDNDEKLELLNYALGYRKEYVHIIQNSFPSNYWTLGVGLIYAGQIEADLAKVKKNVQDNGDLLAVAISDLEAGVTHINKWVKPSAAPLQIAVLAGFEDTLGEKLLERYLSTQNKEDLIKGNKVTNDAAENFKRSDLPSRVAESYWKIARNYDCMGEFQKAVENFEKAFAGYKVAAQKIHQFGDFYLDYANYMKAWSEIETAKIAHNSEKYEIAMQHYEKTSNLLKQSKSWDYLSSNFRGWSLLEEAEGHSRKEDCAEAIEAFENAVKLMKESERLLRSKLGKIDKTDERELVRRLIEASETRIEYCSGRIAIEEAKLLDRQGDHAASSEAYRTAAEIFRRASQLDSEQMGEEAKPLIYLCQAWQKMTLAEARGSPIMYEEAAELFKLANEHATKESTSFLALGHSSFCKALEAGLEFEITRNMTMYEETLKHLDAAANYYVRDGFETASDYTKGTQRLFDGYVFMSNAKREKDPEKEKRYYLMAEKVLQISAECFSKAKHPEKTGQVQRLLKKVTEEKELALSLSEVLHAPTITSSTASFSTISPNEERAVGLERFEHAEIQSKIVQPETEIKIGENMTLGIQFVNVGKETVLLSRVENLVPAGFQLVGKPDYCEFEGSKLIMKGKKLEPLKTEEIKFTLKSFVRGSVEIKPRIVCVDQTGREMFLSPEPVMFSVLEAVLPGRVSTGYTDLDNLLFGGIPENYAVILTAPSSDEREQLIRKFLEAGIKVGQITFFITLEAGNMAGLAEEFQSNFFLFICNPRAEVMIKSLPNVFKMKGVESLTDLDIALTKSFRMLDSSRSGPRRACIEIISDVLLQHHAVITRKWLSGLLPDLRSKGFTTLAVVNPQMHPQEEVQAILGLFEGEIRISEKETEKGLEKTLRIRKLYGQKYLENELLVTKEKLER